MADPAPSPGALEQRVASLADTAQELKSLSSTLDAWLKEWRAGNAG